MSLSQKHEGKCLVPWFCSAEWHLVYDNIFGPNSNDKTKREALDILKIWKARTPLLSCGVEGTYIILEAILLDRSVYEIYNLKLLLSTSVMRFLNICAVNTKTQNSFCKTAKKMNIPPWLVNLRHSIAHGQNLSSIDVLDRALKFCLKWVREEYWKPSAPEIKDYIDETQFASDKAETLKNSLQPLVSNYCYITLVTHSNWNYVRVRDIIDKELRNLFLDEVKSMIDTDDIDESTHLSQILESLWEKIEEILKEYSDLENRYQVLAELLLEDVFLGNIDDREDIVKDSEKVPDDFIHLWENMLKNFKTDMLGALIEQLLQVLKADNVKHECKIVAGTWIFKIAQGLEKRLLIRSITNELKRTGSKPRTVIEATINEKLYAKYKKKKILKLNSKLETPDVISDCSKFKKFILEVPSQYIKMFIGILLDLNNTLKLPQNREKILELLNIYISNENGEETLKSTKIHNVEELLAMEVDDQPIEEMKENIENKVSEVSVNGHLNTYKIWRRVTETNFEKCPIGILPWQSSSTNPFLA